MHDVAPHGQARMGDTLDHIWDVKEHGATHDDDRMHVRWGRSHKSLVASPCSPNWGQGQSSSPHCAGQSKHCPDMCPKVNTPMPNAMPSDRCED